MTTISTDKDSSGLCYKIFAQNGSILAWSVEYRSIYLVEEALRGLRAVSDCPHSLSFAKDDNGAYQISMNSSRRKVKFKKIVSESSLRRAFTYIKNAQILGARPSNQKRTDIGGTLTSLI